MGKKVLDWIRTAQGSAIWDAAKWLWASGGSLVTLIAQWVLGVARGHPDITALVIAGGSALLFVLAALVIRKNPAVVPEAHKSVIVAERALAVAPKGRAALQRFRHVQDVFLPLKFSEKVALKKVYDNQGTWTFDTLVALMEQMGFCGDPSDPVNRVLNDTDFISQNVIGGPLRIKNSVMEDLQEIFQSQSLI
jgi:hypothetical protein